MATGLSSSLPPYLINLEPNVSLTSIITVGDAVPGSFTGVWGGIPDGIGAFDNGDGTLSIIVNHEIGNTLGAVRAHGSIGAYIETLIVDKATFAVTSGHDSIQTLNLWNDATDTYYTGTFAFSRFCSSDLADTTAYFNAATGNGTDVRIYLTGEESTVEGKAVATIVSGANAGQAFELPALGNLAFENLTANPFAQDKTIVAATDDGQNGQVYIYVGDKQAAGSDIEKAGLTNGKLYGIKVAGIADESNTTIANGTFSLQEVVDAVNKSGATIDADSEAAGITSFLRPEDSAWDPQHPNVLYFTTTNSITGPSRLYKATFTDISHPELGGTIEAVLDGTEGQKMFDNLSVGNGKVILQEDPGNNAYVAKMYEYDIATDKMVAITTFDANQFAVGAPGFITQDEETSGVIDVTSLLGTTGGRSYLFDAQVHKATNVPATVEGGQLLLMTIADVHNGGAGDDLLNGDGTANTILGYEGNDTINGGSGNDTIDGGDGNDTAIYTGNFSAYTTSHVGDVVTISGPNGTDTVTNVEHFQFANGTYDAIGVSGTEDTDYIVSAADLLAGHAGDGLTVGAISVTNGIVTDNGDGTFTVHPNANVNGAQTISYDVVDSLGTTTPALFGFTLAAVNDAPTALALSKTTIAENSNNGTVLGTLTPTDVDNASGFTYSLLDAAGGAFSVNATTGSVFVANGNLLDYETATTKTLDIQVKDAAGDTYHQQFTINLTNVVENQTFTGTFGADSFTAQSDDNWTVDSKAGNDTIVTAGGADVIYADGGSDSVSTGAGNDTIVYTGANAGLDAIDGGAGTDTITVNANNTKIGLTSITGIEVITSAGFAGAKIVGGSAADHFDFSGTTLNGIVSIDGGAGNDQIVGSAGADKIIGGAGADVLTGGAGADIFAYASVFQSGVGAKADHITDFAVGVDKIDLSAIDAIASLAGKQSFAFIGSDDFTALGQVRIGMSAGHVVLQANTAGNLAADFTVVLDNNAALTIGDLVL